MGSLTTVEVSAIVSAVVTASFSTLVRYGEAFATFVRTRLPDDHTAINAGSLRLGVDSQLDRIAVQVSCAPSRRLTREGMKIDEAIRAAHASFGAYFPVIPENSGPDVGVSFAVMADDDAFLVDRRLRMYPNGRIDLYWCIPVSASDNPSRINILCLLAPLIMLANFVRGPDYDTIWKRRRLRFRRRFDWRFFVAMYIHDQNRQSRSWQLQFPGLVPQRAAERNAFCPSPGYAVDELTGWPMTRSVESLARVAVRSLLFHNGYHDVEATVSDVVAHVTHGISDTAVAGSTTTAQ